MKITPITSAANDLLKRIRGLQIRQNREKSGLFLVEGAKLVAEAYAKGIKVKEVLVSKTFLQSGIGEIHGADISSVSLVDDKLFKELVTTEASCGIVAMAQMPSWSEKDLFRRGTPLLVIADAIQDPGNLGTMLRTALAARASGMILCKGTVDRFNPKVVRSAAGALFVLPTLAELSIDRAISLAKEHGLNIIACEPTASKLYWEADMTGPTALIFGNEGQGFSQDVLARAGETVVIPMNENSESLNVSISAGIVLFGAVEQRLKAKRSNC